jgi:hypothetical protein
VAASSGPEDDDPLREAKAYNASIYLMLGMPYALLGGLGLLFYRSARGQQKRSAASRSDSTSGENGGDFPPSG